MTPTFAFVFSTGTVVLLAVLMIAMPAIVPRTVPLGVTIPPARTADPAVRSTILRYRLGQVVAGVIAIAVGAVLAFTAPVAGVILPTFVFLALSVAVYLVARRRIVAAKHEGDWYRGVAVQRSAEVTAPVHHHLSIVWPIVAIVAFAAETAIGVALYPRLPDPMPVHFNAAGIADRYEPKSIWSVFSVLPIAVGVAVLLFAIAIVISRAPLRATPGDAPAGALARAGARRNVLASMLAQLTAAIAVSLSLINVLVWIAPSTAGFVAGIIVLIVLIVAVVAVATVRLARITLASPVAPTSTPAPASAPAPAGTAVPGPTPRAADRAPVDDDRHWKGGILYVNRDDPAVWVPRRFGVGWTPNLGSPAGLVIGVVLLAVILGALTAVVLLPLLSR
jgi:uncharacterized membrane protein